MNVEEAIIEILHAEDVDRLFTLMAEDTMSLISLIEEDPEHDIDVVHVRHEQHAVAMADGYSRGSDRFGVALVGRGPGIAHTGNALLNARNRGSNVLVLLPEPSQAAELDVKDFDQEMYLQSTIGEVFSTESTDTVTTDLREAFRRLRIGRGPVAVQIPWNLWDEPIDEFAYQPAARAVTESQARLQPDDAQIEEAVERYLDSDATKPPIILVGQGAVTDRCRDPILELAERMNALLCTTLQAQGFLPDHPYNVGFVGTLGSSLAYEYANESDFVVAIGASLNLFTTDHGNLFNDDATVVHVDTSPFAIDQQTLADVGILGDAELTARALHAELASWDIDRRGEFWTDRTRSRIAEFDPFDRADIGENPDEIDPRELVDTLDSLLPADRIVITDGGHNTRWILDAMTIPDPESFIWTIDSGAIGQSLPIGVGTAAGAQSRPCFAVTGDAGFLMAVQEVETAVRHQIPLTVIVFNDASLNEEYHNLQKEQKFGDPALQATPDLAAVSRAMGANATRVTDVAELDEADFSRAITEDTPMVVDCVVDHSVVNRKH